MKEFSSYIHKSLNSDSRLESHGYGFRVNYEIMEPFSFAWVLYFSYFPVMFGSHMFGIYEVDCEQDEEWQDFDGWMDAIEEKNILTSGIANQDEAIKTEEGSKTTTKRRL